MAVLDSPEVEKLLTLLDEIARWRPGRKGVYLDEQGALASILADANHVVMGRRGSGKTRLLDELDRKLNKEKTWVVTVEAEELKFLSFPDILIQIIRRFLEAFSGLLDPSPEFLSKEWWLLQKQKIRHPLKFRRNRKRRLDLLSKTRSLLNVFCSLLDEAEESQATYSVTAGTSTTTGSRTNAGVGSHGFNVGSEWYEGSETGEVEQRERTQNETKSNKVERLLGDFKSLLIQVCETTDRSVILAVDDFYFVRRADQPVVIDYMHRICKNTNAFLKIATIKHRTHLKAVRGGVVTGVTLGHEIQEINLELTLGQFWLITKFLEGIWAQACKSVGISDPKSLFRGDGFQQAVLASGGIPRDFFGVIKLALRVARLRNEDAVGKLRINEAARQYAEDTKLPEINEDLDVDADLVKLLLYDISRFAKEVKKKNCFHVDLDQLAADPEIQHLIDSLVDSRLIHLISDDTTNSKRAGRRFAAYLVDVGLYGHPQRRGDRSIEEVEFWEKDNAGRLKNLERSPIYSLRTVEQLRGAVQATGIGEKDARDILFDNPEPEEMEEEPNSQRKSIARQIEIEFPPLPEHRIEE